jgi:hypothetical protein
MEEIATENIIKLGGLKYSLNSFMRYSHDIE